MKIRIILLTSALLAPVVAAAHGAPPASSEQLLCDLTKDCGEDADTPTRTKPDTRGFQFVDVGASQAKVRPAAAVATRPEHKPSTQLVAPAAPAAQMGRRHPRGEVGHANLEIAFLSGSATLTDDDKAAADQFVKVLQAPALAGKRFVIGGHTSAVGSRTYNQDLSERRAQAVVDYLASQGANRSQFDVKGFGFDEPLPGTTPSAPVNRRVEIVVVN